MIATPTETPVAAARPALGVSVQLLAVDAPDDKNETCSDVAEASPMVPIDIHQCMRYRLRGRCLPLIREFAEIIPEYCLAERSKERADRTCGTHVQCKSFDQRRDPGRKIRW